MQNITQEYVTQRILPEEEYTTNEEYYFKDGVKTLKDGLKVNKIQKYARIKACI